MNSTEIVKVLADNPDLPVRALVNNDVCGCEGYNSWFASLVRADVTELAILPIGGDGEDRIWHKLDADNIRQDYLIDNPSVYIDGLEGNWINNDLFDGIYNGETTTAAEVEQLIDDYMANIAWEKCILIYVGL